VADHIMAAVIIIRLTRVSGSRLPIAPDPGRRSDWGRQDIAEVDAEDLVHACH
jgi:hypothetical protein